MIALVIENTSYWDKVRLSSAHKVNRLFPRRSPVWTPLIHGEWIIVNFDDAKVGVEKVTKSL